jgi:hypothetical protein
MTDEDRENHKLAVDRYLDQIKILSALATALLLAPAAIQVISDRLKAAQTNGVGMLNTKSLALAANVAFLLVIILSYVIYSTLVGEINRGTFNVYRTATRIFSLAQLILLAIGLILLAIVFYRMF